MVLNPSGVQQVCLEGYGPEGGAVLLECRTEDPERLRALLRDVFRAHGGFLGAEGAVRYLFDRVGWMRFAATDPARLTAAAYAAGAERVCGIDPEELEVRTDPQEFEAIRRALALAGWVPSAAAVSERAAQMLALPAGATQRWRDLLQALKQVQGVHQVYSNVAISDPSLALV
ncbi:MAG: YebC/PmpR family DNA-binding transcriptional regulator [Steroidobacteraceae bacterium]